ncbi:MAG: peptide chain release factor 1 [Myxococcales bacterium]|nr:peptide chain release factor 1 [Myxococcales bacterium]
MLLPLDQLQAVARRFEELEQLMCSSEVLADPKRMQKLNKERVELEPLVRTLASRGALERRLAELRDASTDPELRELAEAEIPELEQALVQSGDELALLLLPRDPHDERNTVVEIRSGEGGEEAALFAADLYRMIARYAARKGWKIEVLSTSESSAGGYKEVILLVSGKQVYSHLRYEGGVHRVQRVPATEAQGRVHTSTATVAVLPEADEVDVQVDDADLEISIAASGGPGGQGVNTTNSAVLIRHVPTGILVKCQDERSQIKNQARALTVLRSRLLEIERRKQEEAIGAERRSMVGSAERAEKIRTYNFPQSRVTDHRINLTSHALTAILDGDLDVLVGPLRAHRQAELLKHGVSLGVSR